MERTLLSAAFDFAFDFESVAQKACHSGREELARAKSKGTTAACATVEALQQPALSEAEWAA